MAEDRKRLILFGIIILIIIGMKDITPKETVADVEGKSCIVDTDCPCWGEYTTVGGGEITAYGLGTSSCENGNCDTTYCFDVQPIGEWTRDNPWQWLKDNPMMVVVIIGLTLLIIYWPAV